MIPPEINSHLIARQSIIIYYEAHQYLSMNYIVMNHVKINIADYSQVKSQSLEFSGIPNFTKWSDWWHPP